MRNGGTVIDPIDFSKRRAQRLRERIAQLRAKSVVDSERVPLIESVLASRDAGAHRAEHLADAQRESDALAGVERAAQRVAQHGAELLAYYDANPDSDPQRVAFVERESLRLLISDLHAALDAYAEAAQRHAAADRYRARLDDPDS